MSKCRRCKGKGTLPGFNDSPGDSRFIFCSSCNATGKAKSEPDGEYPLASRPVFDPFDFYCDGDDYVDEDRPY